MIVNYFIYAAIILMALPVSIFSIQVVCALFNKNKQINLKGKNRPSISVLMPAHNEELVIGQSIASIKPQLQAGDSLIVIADNCTDKTAAIASSLGAKVVERFNDSNRGKGYALDFGLNFIKSNPTDVVIVIDADCTIESNCLQFLSEACVGSKRPVQALYLMESQPNPSIKERIATFAWIVKNKVRPLGFSLLGLPCQLMGTGMAFAWEDISQVDMATGHIVEDMKLGIDLARMGKSPLFLLEAKVKSIFPPNDAAVKTQRSRWEHGHLSLIVNEVPILIFEGIKSKNLQLFGLACDLLVPPLAMLSLICLLLFIVSIVSVGGLTITFSLSLLVCLMLATFLAWIRFGRGVISFKQLCYAPIYALIKIPLYIKFFLSRQVEWVRSKRD